MQAVEYRQQREYERFEKNKRFEEMTDLSERLSYPIDSTISYRLRGDVLYAKTDTVERPFHVQTLNALTLGAKKYQGDQAFELTRLRLEHEEALLVDSFATGRLSGNILVKYSKVPDAIVENRTSINGYRRDLLRSFVRIYYRTEDGVDCRLFTLDQNSQLGNVRISDLLGIDTTRPSEEVLADYAIRTEQGDLESFVDMYTELLVHTYDQSMFEERGERTHAGSIHSDKQNALIAVAQQSELVDSHMRDIAQIVALGRGEAEMEVVRKRTAAAIKLASEGHNITSSSDADVMAEVETGNYDRECATGVGMNQASTAENIWKNGECVVCMQKKKIGSCGVCLSCEEADNRGEDLLKLREKNLKKQKEVQKKVARIAINENKEPRVSRYSSKKRNIEMIYGPYATIKTTMGVGGAKRVVVHRFDENVVYAEL